MARRIETAKAQRRKAFILFLFCFYPARLSPSAQPPRGMTPADTLRVAAVGDPQISRRTGNRSSTRSRPSRATRRARLSARAARTERAAARRRRWSTGEWNVSRPRWSPDGRRVAFLAAQRAAERGSGSSRSRSATPRFVAAVALDQFSHPLRGRSLRVVAGRAAHRLRQRDRGDRPSRPRTRVRARTARRPARRRAHPVQVAHGLLRPAAHARLGGGR